MKPLANEQIARIYLGPDYSPGEDIPVWAYAFARKIEAALAVEPGNPANQAPNPDVHSTTTATKAPGAADEVAWLIEHSGALPGGDAGSISWLFVQPKFEGYGAQELGFTHDASKALRFSRKVDAEAVLKMHLGIAPPDWYSKPFSVTEHMWSQP